jgi:hypothetical protein
LKRDEKAISPATPCDSLPGGACGEVVSGTNLSNEYREITARLVSASPFQSIRDYGTLCAIAVARVKALELELSGTGHAQR